MSGQLFVSINLISPTTNNLCDDIAFSPLMTCAIWSHQESLPFLSWPLSGLCYMVSRSTGWHSGSGLFNLPTQGACSYMDHAFGQIIVGKLSIESRLSNRFWWHSPQIFWYEWANPPIYSPNYCEFQPMLMRFYILYVTKTLANSFHLNIINTPES